MRRSMSLLLPLCCLVIASCAGDAATPTTLTPTTAAPPSLPVATTTAPRADATLVDDLGERYDAVVRGHANAWMSRDPDAVLAFYDGDTIHDDSLFGVLLRGDELVEMPAEFMAGFPDYEVRVTDVFVAPGVALEFNEGWGMTLRGVTFTEDAPMLEVDRIEIGDDGLIGRWSLLYGLDMWEKWGAPGFRMDAAREVLFAHAKAWVDRIPDEFDRLYAPDAERVDDLLGMSGVGPAVIADLADELAGMNVDLDQAWQFADSRAAAADVEVVGAVYDVVSLDGCSMRFAVVLTVEDGLVTHEEVFWDPAPLIACGWSG